MAMLKPRADPTLSAQQLYAKHNEEFKAAFQSKIKDQPTSLNLPTFNRLRGEMWDQLTSEEQAPWIQQAAELQESKARGGSDQEKARLEFVPIMSVFEC